MSNLDTTLREKWNSYYDEQTGLPPNEESDATFDFFIDHFHQLMNEKREAIEGKRKEEPSKSTPATKHKSPKRSRTTHYNSALDDVLSILND